MNADESAPRDWQRGAADPYFMIGDRLPEWDVAQWANIGPLMLDGPPTLQGLRGRVIVVRFWTGASDACAHTMPALEQLAEEFRGRQVVFIGIYFDSGALVDDVWGDARLRAKSWGVTFPIAEDRSTLNTWWRSRFDNLPDTPTLVIGRDGRVDYVHPGPELFPTDDPAEKICDDDYRALRAAISRALGEQLAETRADG